MNFDRIIQQMENRSSRGSQPFKTFYESFNEIRKAADHVTNDSNFPYSYLLERSIVITAVTAIETYYKDVLDLIFSYCNKDFFLPVIKEIHKTKYGIDELLTLADNHVHPVNLISANQSFQSTETIDSVYSKFLKGSLWSAVYKLMVRWPDNPSSEMGFEPWMLEKFKGLFKIRHELVHNPKSKEKIITDEMIAILACSLHMVLGSNCILMDLVMNNKADKPYPV